MEDKAKELLNNDELLKGIVTADTADELMAVLKENEIQLEEGLSPEHAFELVQSARTEELGEQELESVSGGILFATAAAAAGMLIVGGTMLCFLAGYGYQKFFAKKK